MPKENKSNFGTSNSSTNETHLVAPKLDKKKLAATRFRRRFLKRIWLVRAVLVTALLSVLVGIVSLVNLALSPTKVGEYTDLAKAFVFRKTNQLSSFENRVNVLILGKGGETHETPDLTDTIIFASLSLKKDGGIDMISLPRDIWIKSLRTKLNSVYYWGNQKQSGGGLVLAKSAVEEIVGEPVHYAIVVDFEGFKKSIDAIGGVEVDVISAFVDDKYPIPGKENDECDGDQQYRCRYERLEFTKGVQVLDGDRALKFARSRNAQGDEGTDLARAKRQQLILMAMRDKILSREIMFSPSKVKEILGVLLESYETDLTQQETAVLARVAFDARDSVNSHVLSEELIYNPPPYLYDNLYVFLPASETGGWEDVQGWIDSILK